jgi:hypothetical protein
MRGTVVPIRKYDGEGIKQIAVGITKRRRTNRPTEVKIFNNIKKRTQPFTTADLSTSSGVNIGTTRIMLRILEDKIIEYVGRNKFGYHGWRRRIGWERYTVNHVENLLK